MGLAELSMKCTDISPVGDFRRHCDGGARSLAAKDARSATLTVQCVIVHRQRKTLSVRTATVVALVWLTGAPLAYPWGGVGHRVVAIIAEQRLSPEVRARINRLLFDGRYAMHDIASCADQIRAGPPRPGSKYPYDPACDIVAGKVTDNTGPWHFIDIPLPTKEKDLEKFCPNTNCVVDQIERFTKILHDSNDDGERRRALLFLVHFMGDIHQPLHATERACDQGGNKERVNFYLGEEKVPNNLHAVWDSSLVDKLMKDEGFTSGESLASDLIGRIDEDDAPRWARATVPEIAWESYKAAKHAYRGIPFQDFCDKDTKPGEATDLTPRYESAGVRIVCERLMKAGVRLAALLEQNVTR
jgi:hypothetical protein